MTFPSVNLALAYWTERMDRSPLAAATAPPCDVLGDETHDAMLARFFMRLCEIDTVSERVFYLDEVLASHNGTVEALRSVSRYHQPEAPEAAARIQRMLAVVAKWQSEILDGAAREAVEGRVA